MGPTLSGLDKLLKMPTGCGEQTMILFVPNIYVLRYLISTSQVTSGSPIKTKAIEYMKSGKTAAYGFAITRIYALVQLLSG